MPEPPFPAYRAENCPSTGQLPVSHSDQHRSAAATSASAASPGRAPHRARLGHKGPGPRRGPV